MLNTINAYQRILRDLAMKDDIKARPDEITITDRRKRGGSCRPARVLIQSI
jgi:hypothetical protein